ncbi:MAG TPA: hypothetical protein VI653_00115 [Steroidobacteraceae bacterium]
MWTAPAVPPDEDSKAVSNLRKVMLFGALLGGYTWAAGPTGTGLDHCPQIVADKERLACFDREFASLAQRKSVGAAAPGSAIAPSAESSGATAAAKPPTPNTPAVGELTPEQAVGLPPAKILKLQKSPNGTEIKALDARIESVSVNSAGRGVFKLDNGQVWQQVEPDSRFEVHPGDSVHLSKALMGSFFMSASKKMSTRVSRLE